MSESAGIRRSSRRREKRAAVFDVGDIVEINRVRGRTKGRLVSRLTDDASAKTRWLVAFDDESWAEEGMNESNFGAVLGKADLSKLVAVPPVSKNTGASKKNKKQKKSASVAGKDSRSAVASGKSGSYSSRPPSPNHVSVTSTATVSSKASPVPISSPEDTRGNSNNKKNKKKRKAASTTVTPAAKEESSVPQQPEDHSDCSAHKSSAAAARAARSLRRQAKLEAEQSKRQLYQPPAKKAKTKDSDVVRVPMLTGTLLLYRGPRRRAEFIYKK